MSGDASGRASREANRQQTHAQADEMEASFLLVVFETSQGF
jgi:hypothetical protein